MSDNSEPARPAVPPVVAALAAHVQGVLAARLIGVYLGGSASMGDFASASSDWDVLVVTDGWLTDRHLAALGVLHRTLLEERPEAERIEGDYAPLEAIVPRGTTVPVPGIRRGVFVPRSGEVMLSADNIANMRLHGIPVRGPATHEILPVVPARDVRAAVREMILDAPAACGSEIEAADEILDLARSLRALETGLPTTKSEGAAWALQNLEPRWHPAIRRALAARRGEPIPAEDRLLRTALAAMVRATQGAVSETCGAEATASGCTADGCHSSGREESGARLVDNRLATECGDGFGRRRAGTRDDPRNRIP